MKLRLGKVYVDEYKSGESAGQLRPFAIPDNATIVQVRSTFNGYAVYYVVPA